MDSAIISRIENALTEQLNSAIEDIVMSVMENELECHDFDTQYDAAHEAICDYSADISELAENIGDAIRVQMEQRQQQRLEEVTAMALETFTHTVLPAVKAHHEEDGKVDIPARREAFSNWVDHLNKNGEISDYEAHNIDADVDSL